MKFIEEFRQDLINFTKETGIKPYRLADSAKVPRPTVYRFINGERPGIQAETYIKLKIEMNKHFEKDAVWTPDPKKEVNDGEATSAVGG